ncbi:MAG TPA: hypothetical protein PKE21_17115 [Flavobacteriales bacterium]|nr:hypothetical protein [Flavobacteriales bacterium]HMR29200.1 hypothetical protein [Flavobacteriales bacterium]
MRNVLLFSAFIRMVALPPCIQAQQTSTLEAAEALLRSYQDVRDTAGVESRLELLFRADGAITASTSPMVRWDIHRELGTLLYTLNAEELAFEQMYLELEAAQDGGDTVSTARAVSGIGARYLDQQQWDSAAHYMQWSLRLAPRHDPYTLAGLYNNLAILHLDRREPDLADRYLDTVVTLLEQGQVNPWVDIQFSQRDNRADAALLRGEDAQARAWVAQNVSLLRAHGSSDIDLMDRYRRYSIKLASLWLDAHEPLEAGAVLDALRADLAQMPAGIRQQARMELLRLDHRLARAVGDPVREARASRLLLALNDSLDQVRRRERQATLGAVTAFGVRRMKAELAAQAALDQARVTAAEARTRSRTIILWLVGVLATVSLLALAGFFRSRIRRKQLEKQQVETELANKRKDIQQIAQDLNRKQQWTREVLDAAGDIIRAKPVKAEVTAKVELLKDNVRSQLRVDEQREWLYREVEVVNTAFYERLRTRQPDLTDKELELCGMVRSGLNNATIAELRHIAPTSVRVAKYRLKLKLGLGEEDDLGAALAGI